LHSIDLYAQTPADERKKSNPRQKLRENHWEDRSLSVGRRDSSLLNLLLFPPRLATAGRLVFGGDMAGNLVAYDAALGKPLWHARLGQVSNAPETYLLDGEQYLLVAAGDTLYAFYLY